MSEQWFEDLTANNIDILDISGDGVLSLTLIQARIFAGTDVTLAAGDKITVANSAENLDDLSKEVIRS